MRLVLAWGVLLGAALGAGNSVGARSGGQDEDPAAVQDAKGEPWLVLEPVDERGRRPFRPDAVFAAHLLRSGSDAPEAGDSVSGETGTATWETRSVSEKGGPDQPEGAGRIGWGYRRVHEPSARVALAKLHGASQLYVNGDGFVGDVYRFGFGGVPVALNAGANEVYVNGIRRGFGLEFQAPPAPLFLADWDTTRPDWERGGSGDVHVGVVAINASLESRVGLRLGDGVHFGDVFDLPPLGVTQVSVSLPRSGFPEVAANAESMEFEVALYSAEHVAKRADAAPISAPHLIRLPVRAHGARVRRTFRSAMDRSVQKYSLIPPTLEPLEGSEDPPESLGLIVSLHGASVQSDRQASCYQPKPDFWIVAPTNRRPFGFDWQDWGRRDAYEVMELALDESGVGTDRIYLTGHSMGGHGTWHLAANDPDMFAAIAPSAGWESFDSYGGRPKGERRALWHAADGASQTLALIDNLKQLPTYVLHGEADNNVPPSEARTMLAALRAAGAEPDEHFEPEAGHWWGNRCVDWKPFEDMYRAHRIPQNPDALDFTTVDPGVDSDHHWISVLQPIRYGERSRVRAARTSKGVEVQTENVGAIVIRFAGALDGSSAIELDGQALTAVAGASEAAFTRRGDAWRAGRPAISEKRPQHTGPFKRAFDRGFVLVWGSAGEDDETRELLARARHDAQVWWYRGNGATEIVSDRAYFAQRERFAGRNVILYGNRDTNAAYAACLSVEVPIDARRGRLRVGDELWERPDLGCVFVVPSASDPDALVGVFADTGVAGTRLGYTLGPFVSGVGYPDYAAFSSDISSAGDGGVLAAGFFDAAWQIPK